MTKPHPVDPAPHNPLRLWPGVVLVILQWLAWMVLPAALPEAAIYGAVAGPLGGLLVLAWWIFFSRAAWSERLGALGLMIAAVFATARVVHPSIANGMMGMMLVMYAIPVLSLALVLWAVVTRRLSDGLRRAALVPVVLLACGFFALLKTGGVDGDGRSDFMWRWTPTAEERLLARAGREPAVPVPAAKPPAAATAPGTSPVPRPGGETIGDPSRPADAADSATAKASPARAEAGGKAELRPSSPVSVPGAAKPTATWPGFRGPDRDSIVRGVRIATDWTRSPPAQLWRRPIGPGWSSFAVDAATFFTQEQRGDEEIVACYKVQTGELVWLHRDSVRFWESNAGPGPRATPTLSNGRVYTLGATGVLNALDAGDGSVVWSRNVASDTGTAVPTWGFAGSPQVVDDLVIIAAAGNLAAYDTASGTPRWSGPAHGGGYSSPHLLSVGGIPQVLLQSDFGVTSVVPASGAVLWEHEWPGAAIVQPALTAEGDVLIGTGGPTGGLGMRRLTVARNEGGWDVDARWTSAGLKPYFNDFVVHEGYAFGFDGSILACIDLKSGARVWKGGRYGYGQLLLLPDQDALLVLSEDGELALVGATPDQFREIARFPGIEGKTWNHPVLAGDILLVRNGEEMAAFRLPLDGR